MVEMHTQPYEWFWREVYSYHFPCFVDCSPAVGIANPTYSRTGLDRVVYCGNGADYRIKEVNVLHHLYPNIPIRLSTVSTDRSRTEIGWIYADFPIDKIAFGYCDPTGAMEKSGAFILDYPAFQRAFITHEQEWKQRFEVVCKDWPDYTGQRTEHLWMLVPCKVMLNAISDAQIVKCLSLSSMRRELEQERDPFYNPTETLAPLRITEAA